MSSYILFQLQLSTYTLDGKFILTADSNWQIFITKVINMIKIDRQILIDVLIPNRQQCLEDPYSLIKNLGLENNITLIEIPIEPNALKTRYDFPYNKIAQILNLENKVINYTHVYINDPMLLRHYKALFFLTKKAPKFILQIHFLDSPHYKIAPDEVNYWLGTVEAIKKSDVTLFHCNSMYNVFEAELKNEFNESIVPEILSKCDVWKDGYSIDEIRKPIDMNNVRFNVKDLENKTIIWVPNRVGGLGKSFDYTNNGAFLLEKIPELWKIRQDFVVLAGNPNQKISNEQLKELCPAYYYFNFGAINRDEYRWISQRTDIVVGLYGIDTNGGLASLESIEFNAIPLFTNCYEYKHYFDIVNWPEDLRVHISLNDCVNVLSHLLDVYKTDKIQIKRKLLKEYIQLYAAYEFTTAFAVKKLGLI